MILSEERRKVSSPHEAAALAREVLSKDDKITRDREHFYVLGLNAAGVTEYVELAHLGGANECPVYPREVFRRAVTGGCSYIITVHNHPSGTPAPSRKDLSVFERLNKAGQLLGMPCRDHIIVGEGDQYWSERVNGAQPGPEHIVSSGPSGTEVFAGQSFIDFGVKDILDIARESQAGGTGKPRLKAFYKHYRFLVGSYISFKRRLQKGVKRNGEPLKEKTISSYKSEMRSCRRSMKRNKAIIKILVDAGFMGSRPGEVRSDSAQIFNWLVLQAIQQ